LEWLLPPANLPLSNQEVHVWHLWLDQPEGSVEKLALALCPDERSRAARFRSQVSQQRFMVARGFTRAVLARYLSVEPAHVEFAYTPQGKPYLPRGKGQGLAFNLAHSRDLALCAVTRHNALGVDVEYVHALPDADQIVGRFFSLREACLYESVSPQAKQRVFFDVWTRKEACLKALGYGIVHGLDRIEVTLPPGQPVRLLSIDGDREQAANWSLEALTPADDYVAAVAVSALNVSFSYWACVESHQPAKTGLTINHP
jgi:4'-phosphopantetheinyl transferase